MTEYVPDVVEANRKPKKTKEKQSEISGPDPVTTPDGDGSAAIDDTDLAEV